MITNSLKKEIISEWFKGFPELSVYSQNKLYKVLCPFVIGLEIFKLPRSEDFRPIFVCYPLWKSELKQCLDEPIFMQEIYDKKGFQFNISYSKHIVFFQEVIECTKKQAIILSQQNVSLKQLFEVFNKQFSQTLIKSSPVGQSKLFEAKLLSALYVNDINTSKQVLNEINNTSKSWYPNLFEWKYGKLDVWLLGLQETITNRDEFLKQIKANAQDAKIAQLKNSELCK
jgi:hypothetical protein